ncbi:24-hydroxycholesterol 7-alpha-hydroxylase-like [Ptychodera flava]|uniref:24-hydroxycholesterol 7-alpha-hydroxylase-like n=1 Tax=Ptychodera flava TaxID=63121 RepID=UPI00396A267B
MMATSISDENTTNYLSHCSVPWVLVVLAVISAWHLLRRKQSDLPPAISGWIPWLGCAIELGKAPLDFIKQCKTKHGSIFTIATTGQRLTFVTELEDFNHFFQSSSVDFQQAVQDAVRHTSNIGEKHFFKSHTTIHDMMKGRLAPSNLHLYCSKLCKNFNAQLNKMAASGKDDLMFIVRRIMFTAVVNNLFGDDVLPTTDEKIQELEDKFVKYDEDFEYGSQLPEFVVKPWAECKHWLLSLFGGVIQKLEKEFQKPDTEQTLLKSLYDNVDREVAPNFSLLLLWASQANAIPITFWTLAFIFSDKEVLKSLGDEIESAVGDREGDLDVTEEDLRKMPGVKRAVLEAIRLRSPGVITRRVVKPFKIREYTIPAGDLLMLSPYWAHRNVTLFPDPEKFNPDRWLKADLEKNVFLDGFVAFGGGRYQCPGRWFALMEIQMLVVLLLRNFDMKLLGPVPKESSLHLVGTQQPATKCHVEFTKVK